MLEYPSEFSAEARTRVELEETRASRAFNESREALAWSPYGPGPDLQRLLIEYILRVWIVFVEEVCQLGERRIWDLARVKKESLESLRDLTSTAWAQKGFDFGGRAHPGQQRRLPEMTSHITGAILPEVRHKFEASDEWRKYEELVLGVGEAWAAASQRAVEVVPKPPDVNEQAKPGAVPSDDQPDNIGTRDTKIRAERRGEVVKPILEKRQWTRSMLAIKAGIDKNCVYDYLAGKRNLQPNTRRDMAEALGIKQEELPE